MLDKQNGGKQKREAKFEAPLSQSPKSEERASLEKVISPVDELKDLVHIRPRRATRVIVSKC